MSRTLPIATFVMTAALSARPQTFQPMPFVFFNPYTNMCLQPVNESTAGGAAIVQQACSRSTQQGSPAAAQEWFYVPNGTSMHFQNAHSGLCLDARGGAENGTPVQQWPCNWISNENWENSINPKGGGAPVKSRVSGSDSYCLDVPGGQKTAGLALQIYRCNGTGAQTWNLNSDGNLVVPKVTGLQVGPATDMVTLYGLTYTLEKTTNCTSSQYAYVTQQLPEAEHYAAPKANINLCVCDLQSGSSGAC